jgi:Ca2+-binding EF-hand superfamily protein
LKNIFDLSDIDCDGYLSYDEFCAAASDHQKLLTNSNIKLIFSLFDRVKNGVTTELDFEYLFPGQGEKWEELVQDIP